MGMEHTIRSVFSPRPMSHVSNQEQSPSSARNSATLRGNDAREDDVKTPEDDNHIAYLTLPSVASSSRRPSTADVVIEKLQVEKIDGGGLTISGVACAGNCHITLMVFGFFFILAGIVLSYVGFAFANNDKSPMQGPKPAQTTERNAEEEKTKDERRKTHRELQIIGPVFIVGGILMVLLGVSLFAISAKITRDEKERRLIMSSVQLSQLESSFSQSRLDNMSPVHTISAPSRNQSVPVLSLRRGSWWMEPTPVEFPLIPAEILQGGDCPPSYSRRGSVRSPSPIADSGKALTQTLPMNDNTPHQHQSAPPQQQQNQVYNQQQQLQKLQQQQLQQQGKASFQQHPPLKRLSSPVVSSFYGKPENTSDIATFPENFDRPTNSFPLKVKSLGSDSGNETQQSSSLRIPSNCYDEESSDSALPVITISSMSNKQEITTTSSSLPKMGPKSSESPPVAAIQPLSTNFPLIRNGIAIPRHSRHCSSPRPENS